MTPWPVRLQGFRYRCQFTFTLLAILAVTAIGCFGGTSSDSGTSADHATDNHTEPVALKRIVILTNTNSPFWDACREGVLAGRDELKLADMGLTAEMEVNNGTPEGQLEKLRQIGNQADVVAVGLSAVDAANIAVAEEMLALQKKGLKVVTIDSDIDRDKFRSSRTAFIGTDNLAGGVALGKCAQQAHPEGGDYVCFVGRTGAQNAIERIGGFAKGAGSKFISKDTMADDTQRDQARENVRNAIRNLEHLKTLVGIWSYNAPAIVDVVREIDRRADFTVVVFDAEPGAIDEMGKGQIDAMVVQNPFAMGYEAVRLLSALVKGNEEVIQKALPKLGKENGDILDTGLKVVVTDDKSPIKKDPFAANVEFMTLEAFKEWLNKYGLKGS